jgi:hypothetical protein
MRKTGSLCHKHGGACSPYDAAWLCDQCAITGYNKCSCGGNARGFGEAMMSMAGCEECHESVSGLDIDARALWNQGVRGYVARGTRGGEPAPAPEVK